MIHPEISHRYGDGDFHSGFLAESWMANLMASTM
ncbi:MAG: hypothetical protein H6Q43_1749, partial [Deltaproteobacteria bacterium]|nr:hypothetical protein [Deltaproteobacteria bacterium]